MKKLSCVLAVAVAAAYLVSCKSDAFGGGCALDGNWKVKSIDIKSEKLSPSIVEMAKGIALQRTFSFTADSVTVNDGVTAGKQPNVGTYSVENGHLKLNTIGGNGQVVEDMKIDNCGANEVTLSFREPADTTAPAIATTLMVIEKVK